MSASNNPRRCFTNSFFCCYGKSYVFDYGAAGAVQKSDTVIAHQNRHWSSSSRNFVFLLLPRNNAQLKSSQCFLSLSLSLFLNKHKNIFSFVWLEFCEYLWCFKVSFVCGNPKKRNFFNEKIMQVLLWQKLFIVHTLYRKNYDNYNSAGKNEVETENFSFHVIVINLCAS